jgi:hypothetical protein
MDKNHIDDLDLLGGTVGADGKYVLTADSVVLLKNTVTAIDGLERSFEDVQTKIKAMVANLQRLLESNSKSVLQSGSTTAVVEINYAHYHACRSLFMHTWAGLRKMPLPLSDTSEKTCSKAYERYFGMTGLEVPKSDDPKAIAKREREQKDAKAMEAIVDLDKAKADAIVRDDLVLAGKIIKEKKRREKEQNKTVLDKLEPNKKALSALVKDSIDEEKINLCIAWFEGRIKLEPKKQVSRAV